MKLVIALLSDIQEEIERTNKQQPNGDTQELADMDCGVIEGRLGALKEFRNALIDVIKEQANEK